MPMAMEDEEVPWELVPPPEKERILSSTQQIVDLILDFWGQDLLGHQDVRGPSSPVRSFIRRIVVRQLPLPLVISGFHFKYPSLRKSISSLPDKAEELALGNLLRFVDAVGAVYDEGVQLVVVSDGRYVSDVLGLSDEKVTCYVRELTRLVPELLHGHHVQLVSMDDLLPRESERAAPTGSEVRPSEGVHPQTLPHQMGFNGIDCHILLPRSVGADATNARRREYAIDAREQFTRQFCPIVDKPFPEKVCPSQSRLKTDVSHARIVSRKMSALRELRPALSEAGMEEAAVEWVRREEGWDDLLTQCFPPTHWLRIRCAGDGSDQSTDAGRSSDVDNSICVNLLRNRQLGVLPPWEGAVVLDGAGPEYCTLMPSHVAKSQGYRLVNENGRQAYFLKEPNLHVAPPNPYS